VTSAAMMMRLLVVLALVYLSKAELFEGDIVLDRKTADIVSGNNRFDAVKSDTRKWTGAVVPYIFASNFESSRRRVVEEAIAEYNKYTCIRWVPRTNQRNYVKFIVGGGCYSYVGMTGGKQDISIGQYCDKKGIVMHEMMHCLGFWHEQSRLDRDQYIRIFWENISNGRRNHNFKKYSHGEADYYGERYDYDSVMHYGNWAFSTNNKKTIEAVRDPKRLLGQRDGFSPIDVKQLNKVYKCKGYENVKVPPPKGCIDRNAKCADYAKWGQCESNERYMLQYCCKTCKDRAGGGGGGTGGTGGGGGTGGSNCQNNHSSCNDWAGRGYCNHRTEGTRRYMKKYCRKACRLC